MITLDHPPHNTIDARTAAALVTAAEEAAASTARAVVVRAAGRIFSSGGDLTMMASFGAGLRSKAAAEAGSAAPPPATRILAALEDIPVPTLASIHRICVAGGLKIALACDLIVAAKTTLLGLVEADVGLTPFMGGVQRFAAREARAGRGRWCSAPSATTR